MAGRFAHFLVAGAAIVGGMIYQGDVNLDIDSDRHGTVKVHSAGDESVIEREVAKVVTQEGETVATDAATKRALSEAVAELVRAEGGLIAARLDDETPAAAITQAEQRRDAARQTVDRLADDVRSKTRDRDSLRQNARDQVRESVREAVRS
jgi:hypothetical protein